MREIKFRAWNGSAMEYGGFSIHATGKIKPLVGLTKVREDSPIMQFTGLKDKNGLEVYEGDILLWNDTNWVCSWNKRNCQYFYESIDSFLQNKNDVRKKVWGEWGWMKPRLEKCTEVIGNIYENPELCE